MQHNVKVSEENSKMSSLLYERWIAYYSN